MRSRKVFVYREKKRVRRPGIHSKTKTSNHKTSRFYKKKYKGQGRECGLYLKPRTPSMQNH